MPNACPYRSIFQIMNTEPACNLTAKALFASHNGYGPAGPVPLNSNLMFRKLQHSSCYAGYK